MFRQALGLTLALSFPHAPAQAQPAADPATPRPEQLYAEMQGLHQRLQEIQARALDEPGLSGRTETLIADVEERMAELDPTTPALLARLVVHQQDIDAAVEAQDRDAFEAAVSEARAVAGLLEATRSKVLVEDGFAERTRSLQADLVAAMSALEPQVPQMLNRLAALEQALSTPPATVGP